MDREELAWASGLFEGEGCFTHNGVKTRRGPGSLATSIGSTDRDVLERFAQAVGFGKVGGPYTTAGYKPVYQWTAYGFEKMQAILAMLWPWLCSRRRERAIELLK